MPFVRILRSLIATHDFDFAKRHCTGMLWLDHGQQVSLGPTPDVIGLYREHCERRRPAV
jgi:ABC-type polysaccharide/polyol phosphate transport system ATPase subunit